MRDDQPEKFDENFLLGIATSSLPWFADQDAKLERRIAAEGRKKSVDDRKVKRLIETREKIATDRQAVEWAASALRDRMVRLRYISEKLSADDRREFDFAVWGAMAAAFEIGSKANTSDSAREFIRSNTGTSAGKTSGSVRLGNRRWTAAATDLAIQIRTKNPSLSQEELASKILDTMKPGVTHGTIVEHIRGIERSGKLPRRKVG